MLYNIRKLKAALTVSVALLVICFTAAVLVLLLCRADEFEIQGTELYSDREILDASQIEEGIFLFSVDGEAAEAEILSRCTFIKSVSVRVKLPDRVIITVTEDPPMFYTNVGVSTVMFGYDLRIAEVRQNSASGDGVLVIMPEVASAVAGTKMILKDGEPTYITKLLEHAARSELFDRMTLISCENTRDAYYEIDGKYRLILGGVSELDVKLKVAKEYLEIPRIANASYATLDLSSPKEVIVTVEE